MFDLIEVFRKTFAEHYKEKRMAKRQIKHLKELLKFWNDIYIKLKSVKNIIHDNSEIMPQREGFGYTEFLEFQNFMLLGYRIHGDGARVGRGYVEDIEHRHIDILQDCILWAKQMYKEKRYNQVDYYCKKYYDECVHFDKNYGTNTQKLAQYPKF